MVFKHIGQAGSCSYAAGGARRAAAAVDRVGRQPVMGVAAAALGASYRPVGGWARERTSAADAAGSGQRRVQGGIHPGTAAAPPRTHQSTTARRRRRPGRSRPAPSGGCSATPRCGRRERGPEWYASAASRCPLLPPSKPLGCSRPDAPPEPAPAAHLRAACGLGAQPTNALPHVIRLLLCSSPCLRSWRCAASHHASPVAPASRRA